MARKNVLISIATAPLKAAKALAGAAERATSGASAANSLAKAIPAAKTDPALDDRMKQQAALRAAQSKPVLTPKGEAARNDNRFKMRKSLT